MEKISRENESLVGRLGEYTVSIENSKTKLEEAQLKSKDVVREFNGMEQE